MVTQMVPTCSYDPLQLIGLDPNELVNAFVAPQLETLPPQLHGAPGHPQEYQTVVLEDIPICDKSDTISGSRNNKLIIPRVPSAHRPGFEMSFWEIPPAGGPLL